MGTCHGILSFRSSQGEDQSIAADAIDMYLGLNVTALHNEEDFEDPRCLYVTPAHPTILVGFQLQSFLRRTRTLICIHCGLAFRNFQHLESHKNGFHARDNYCTTCRRIPIDPLPTHNNT